VAVCHDEPGTEDKRQICSEKKNDCGEKGSEHSRKWQKLELAVRADGRGRHDRFLSLLYGGGMKRTEFAGLGVRLAGGADGDGGGHGPLVVLMHGYGASGDDLVPLWQAVDVPRGTRWAFPEAPLVLDVVPVEARAWWPIDIEEVMAASERGGFDEYLHRVPNGLEQARERMVACLSDLAARLRPTKLVLGGFSQGAILSCDIALRTGFPLDGLVVLSGTEVATSQNTADLVVSRTELPVYQSHGIADGLLPFVQAEKLRDALIAHGMRVTWVPFPGRHEISDDVLRGLGVWLREVFESPRS